ncbi:MAG: hypothetical protein U0531_00945 [Dehalococcoidia bacterium]
MRYPRIAALAAGAHWRWAPVALGRPGAAAGTWTRAGTMGEARSAHHPVARWARAGRRRLAERRQ